MTRTMAGEHVPLVAYTDYPNRGLHHSYIAAGATLRFVGICQFPMRVSRLRWSGVPGLVLLNLKLGRTYTGNGCAGGIIADMSESGVWRFPVRELEASQSIEAEVHNRMGRPLFLAELTAWGVLL